jgi:hypothetical protein
MTATINASTSAGVVTTADTSGILQLQTNGTAALTVDASQNTTIAGTLTTAGVTTFAAGTAALPAITTTGDTNTGIFFPAADTIAFAEGGAEAMRIDASGILGLGVTPSAWGGVYKAIQVGSTAVFGGNTSANRNYSSSNVYWNGSNYKYITTSQATQFEQSDGAYYWLQAASGTAGNNITFTQAMTLDSSGNLLVGKTSTTGTASIHVAATPAVKNGINIAATTTGTTYAMLFYTSDGVDHGYISYTTSGTSYNTTSDYRLKEAILPMTGALAKVAQLKPVTYKWKADGADGQGFIAHELQAVVPECVTREKDAVQEQQYEVTPAVMDEEGNIVTEAVMGTRTVPSYQGIDTSFLVATLTAAIQELKAIVDAQGAEIAALKGAAA